MKVGRWLMAAGLICSSGCLSFLHPVAKPEPAVLEQCQSLPRCCRDHVYVFLVNGVDPLCYGNLEGVRDYLNGLGFTRTYYGQLFHVAQLKKEMLRIHQEDPEARFVLIGFSFGANMVRSMALTARQHDIPIDLLVYLEGTTLKNNPENLPDNVSQTVSVLAGGPVLHREEIDGVAMVTLKDTRHFGSPSHSASLQMLANELAEVASRVPVVHVEDTMPWADQEAPLPRPVRPAPPAAQRDEWDFLKPQYSLNSPTPPTEKGEAIPLE